MSLIKIHAPNVVSVINYQGSSCICHSVIPNPSFISEFFHLRVLSPQSYFISELSLISTFFILRGLSIQSSFISDVFHLRFL